MVDDPKRIEIKNIDGKKTILVQRSAIKGKVSSQDLLNTILIASKLQVEYLIEKLSRGAPLEAAEVKMLKELSEIAKIEPVIPVQSTNKEEAVETEALTAIKSTLYQALIGKSGGEK